MSCWKWRSVSKCARSAMNGKVAVGEAEGVGVASVGVGVEVEEGGASVGVEGEDPGAEVGDLEVELSATSLMASCSKALAFFICNCWRLCPL